MIRKIKRRWYRVMYRLGLWVPATPDVRVWDAEFNYIATLGRSVPAHYVNPWRNR